jgi:hypothetical protein
LATAVHTPDICLIEACADKNRARLVVEIIRQAAARGERVLLVAPYTRELDRVLEILAGHDDILSVRCVGRGESTDILSPVLRGMTLPNRLKRLHAHVLIQAQAELAALEVQIQDLQKCEPLWPRVRDCAQRRQSLEAESALLQMRESQVDAEVEEEVRGDCAPSELAGTLAAVKQAAESSLATLDSGLGEVESRLLDQFKEQETLAAREVVLKKRATARRNFLIWKGDFWLTLLRGDSSRALGDCQARLEQVQQTIRELQASKRELLDQRSHLAKNLQDEIQRIVQREAFRRRSTLQASLARLDQVRRGLDSQWQELLAQLPAPANALPQMDASAVDQACTRWKEHLTRLQAEVKSAFNWLEHFKKNGNSFYERAHHYIDLVAATATALSQDKHFGDVAVNGDPSPMEFDRLVIEGADRISESDLRNLARRAGRWVLLGEPERQSASSTTPPRSRPPSQRHSVARLPRTVEKDRARADSAVFRQLWESLHWQALSPRHSWSSEGSRLSCRFLPLKKEDQCFLEVEPVADSPEIELRILARPGSEPVLAEIVFPATKPLWEAKGFIYRELQELALQPAGNTAGWSEDAGRVALHFGSHELQPAGIVNLGNGVREMIGTPSGVRNGVASAGNQPPTCRLEFDRQAGWNRKSARAWVRAHLRLNDHGRTIRLEERLR